MVGEVERVSINVRKVVALALIGFLVLTSYMITSASAYDVFDREMDALRGRGSILAISEVLTQHADYFDADAPG